MHLPVPSPPHVTSAVGVPKPILGILACWVGSDAVGATGIVWAISSRNLAMRSIAASNSCCFLARCSFNRAWRFGERLMNA